MKFQEYCNENHLTPSEAKELAEKKDRKFQNAYREFKCPAYYGAVGEKGESE